MHKFIIFKENKNKCLYKWANKINNKSYVGSSVKLNRFSEYFCLDKNKTFIGNSYKNNDILK